MPRRTDLQKILILGSGPIVIGQACEFDYSGAQGCRALKEDGFELVLVNSNPATIMTDPEMADATYIEPLTPEIVARVIARERPQALLPTLGGQTALNLAVALSADGTLDHYGVEVIGAKLPAIRAAEDRELFKRAMNRIGLETPRSGIARSVAEAHDIVDAIGLPVVIRPSFTLGGSGGAIARSAAELEAAVGRGLQVSPAGTVLVEAWFLDSIAEIVDFERDFRAVDLDDAGVLRRAKRLGFADRALAELGATTEAAVRDCRLRHGITPTFKTVDTCAAEFAARTPYLYSTWEEEDEAPATERPKVIILGSGPNRIGQGIEFDYCCVHAAQALRGLGIEAIMINCNPETVSTDYDTSDRLYFEPLTLEDVLNIADKERPLGIIVQLGGQTPLKITGALQNAGFHILGTTPESIDRAEDRRRFSDLLAELGLHQPCGGTAVSVEEARAVAARVGYPVLVRPSYVLGGRAMRLVHDERELLQYMTEAVEASPDHPVLIDTFLDDTIEVDVDAVADGRSVFVAGVMEHVEKAGIHSGDAACCLPPYSLSDGQVAELRSQTRLLAQALGVVGLINVQFAIRNDVIHVLEVNPRASRTVPFVSKATGVPLARVATCAMLGRSITELVPREARDLGHVAVKEAVFPFIRFSGVDVVLGPEMKSTGEVMGIDLDFPRAYLKAQLAAGFALPTSGIVFLSVQNRQKRMATLIARRLVEMGFGIAASPGTAQVLQRHGMIVETVDKTAGGTRETALQLLESGRAVLVIDIPGDRAADPEAIQIRRTAVLREIPYYTTIDGAMAAVAAIEVLLKGEMTGRSLQEYTTEIVSPTPVQ